MKTVKFELIKNEDNTRELRKVIEGGNYDKLIFEGVGNTHGILPEDLLVEHKNGNYGDAGTEKILRFKNLSKKVFEGGAFFNPEYAFEVAPDRNVRTVDENSFIYINDSERLTFKNIKYTGPHTEVVPDRGYPKFYGNKEFAHAVEIEGGRFILLEGLTLGNVTGDGVYFRQGREIKNSHITIKNCDINFNARQGVAWGDGNNILLDNVRVTDSGRGGFDIEPPRQEYNAENIIIRNSYSWSHLLAFPMGGFGVIRNLLIENNEYRTGSPTTYCQGDGFNGIRENIIFRGNKRLLTYGSTTACYIFRGTDGILIEKEECAISFRRSLKIIELIACKNVVIRDNDFPDAKYIVLDDTPIEEVKVYGNKQDLKFIKITYDTPRTDPPYLYDRKFYDERRDQQDFYLWAKYYNKWGDEMSARISHTEIVDIVEYDVEKFGEPNVPKDPDFTPYLGEVEEPIEPNPEEPPVVVDPKPEVPVEENPKKFIDVKESVSLKYAKEIFSSIGKFHQYLYGITKDETIGKGLVLDKEINLEFDEDDVIYLTAISKKAAYVLEITISSEIVKPDKPIETEEEVLDMAQKILNFLKRKSSLIAIGVIGVIILLIILL